ncbi:MAG: glutamate synthase subunit beta [Deltaproteobacteria bacterium]|nr:MAG: glutamate synthase subunit beta [Deltaproteobacteria bacterium]
MADPSGFLKYGREGELKRDPRERVDSYDEFVLPTPPDRMHRQASRCMDCGVPFCHTGCPIHNLIPEWNDLVRRERWDEAFERLDATNNFPEITGRVCPAPCESACVLSIDRQPVAIKLIERNIADRAIEEGWIRPRPSRQRREESVAIIGSGPAGLTAAQQLARAGVQVTVFERDDRIGGLMMYGIPDFKLDKRLLTMRREQMEAEGVVFRTGVDIGEGVNANDLLGEFDAVLIAVGAPRPRDLPVPGRHLLGIHQAMDYLTQQNRRVQGDWIEEPRSIEAADQRVIVIGDGDTGSDCIGTANRQGARQIVQFGRKATPPSTPDPTTPWPEVPFRLETSESQEEGCERVWSVRTKRFLGDAESGRVIAVETVDLDWGPPDANGRRVGREVPGSERRWDADLVLLAVGFVGPADTLMKQFGLQATDVGTIQVDADGQTSRPGVFAAGDCMRGASLVVWAIRDGRVAADGILRYLDGQRAGRERHAHPRPA